MNKRVRQYIGALSAIALLNGCSTLGGVDAAKPPAGRLATALGAAAAANLERAKTARAEARRIQIDALLGAGNRQRLSDAFSRVMCAGYDDAGNARADAAELASGQYGVTALIGDSPATIVGLGASLQQGHRFPAPANIQSVRDEIYANRHLRAECTQAAEDQTLDYTTPVQPSGAASEGGIAAFLGVFNLFKTLFVPVIRAGLTRADRARRLEALREWAFLGVNTDGAQVTATTGSTPTGQGDGAHAQPTGLPYLLDRLQADAAQVSAESALQRRQALGRARRAWREVVTAYTMSTPCERQTLNNVALYLDTCIETRRTAVREKLAQFTTAAAAYDTAFDADPARAYLATRLAGLELQNWFAGDMTPEDAAAADAAAFAALQAWLEFFASVEGLASDANRTKITEALDAL